MALTFLCIFGCVNNVFAAAELVRNNEDVAHKKAWGVQLMVAAHRNQLSRVKELIVQGAPVDYMNAVGWTPLTNGASRGHVDIVRELLQAKASVALSKKGSWPPLFLTINSAAMNYRDGGTDDEYLGTIRLLMQAGAASDYRAVKGKCLDAVSIAKDKFPVAVPVIEEELETRLCVSALIKDPGLLLLYVQEPGLVKLVSDYVATWFDDGTYLGFKSSCIKVAHIK